MRESIKKKTERVLKIIDIFNKEYPDADCTLEYMTPLQLVIATQLAAQCTDARVNMVTPALFERYKTVYDFAAADESELMEYIRSTGFFRNKARNIIACCQKLISDFGGEVPKTMDELLTVFPESWLTRTRADLRAAWVLPRTPTRTASSLTY